MDGSEQTSGEWTRPYGPRSSDYLANPGYPSSVPASGFVHQDVYSHVHNFGSSPPGSRNPVEDFGSYSGSIQYHTEPSINEQFPKLSKTDISLSVSSGYKQDTNYPNVSNVNFWNTPDTYVNSAWVSDSRGAGDVSSNIGSWFPGQPGNVDSYLGSVENPDIYGMSYPISAPFGNVAPSHSNQSNINQSHLYGMDFCSQSSVPLPVPPPNLSSNFGGESIFPNSSFQPTQDFRSSVQNNYSTNSISPPRNVNIYESSALNQGLNQGRRPRKTRFNQPEDLASGKTSRSSSFSGFSAAKESSSTSTSLSYGYNNASTVTSVTSSRPVLYPIPSAYQASSVPDSIRTVASSSSSGSVASTDPSQAALAELQKILADGNIKKLLSTLQNESNKQQKRSRDSRKKHKRSSSSSSGSRSPSYCSSRAARARKTKRIQKRSRSRTRSKSPERRKTSYSKSDYKPKTFKFVEEVAPVRVIPKPGEIVCTICNNSFPEENHSTHLASTLHLTKEKAVNFGCKYCQISKFSSYEDHLIHYKTRKHYETKSKVLRKTAVISSKSEYYKSSLPGADKSSSKERIRKSPEDKVSEDDRRDITETAYEPKRKSFMDKAFPHRKPITTTSSLHPISGNVTFGSTKSEPVSYKYQGGSFKFPLLLRPNLATTCNTHTNPVVPGALSWIPNTHPLLRQPVNIGIQREPLLRNRLNDVEQVSVSHTITRDDRGKRGESEIERKSDGIDRKRPRIQQGEGADCFIVIDDESDNSIQSRKETEISGTRKDNETITSASADFANSSDTDNNFNTTNSLTAKSPNLSVAEKLTPINSRVVDSNSTKPGCKIPTSDRKKTGTVLPLQKDPVICDKFSRVPQESSSSTITVATTVVTTTSTTAATTTMISLIQGAATVFCSREQSVLLQTPQILSPTRPRKTLLGDAPVNITCTNTLTMPVISTTWKRPDGKKQPLLQDPVLSVSSSVSSALAASSTVPLLTASLRPTMEPSPNLQQPHSSNNVNEAMKNKVQEKPMNFKTNDERNVQIIKPQLRALLTLDSRGPKISCGATSVKTASNSSDGENSLKKSKISSETAIKKGLLDLPGTASFEAPSIIVAHVSVAGKKKISGNETITSDTDGESSSEENSEVEVSNSDNFPVPNVSVDCPTDSSNIDELVASNNRVSESSTEFELLENANDSQQDQSKQNVNIEETEMLENKIIDYENADEEDNFSSNVKRAKISANEDSVVESNRDIPKDSDEVGKATDANDSVAKIGSAESEEPCGLGSIIGKAENSKTSFMESVQRSVSDSQTEGCLNERTDNVIEGSDQPTSTNESLIETEVSQGFIIPIQGFFCKLCFKIVNGDDKVISQHCQSRPHKAKLRNLKSGNYKIGKCTIIADKNKNVQQITLYDDEEMTMRSK